MPGRRRRTNASAPSRREDRLARETEGRRRRNHDRPRFGRGPCVFGIHAIRRAIVVFTRCEHQFVADRPGQRHPEREHHTAPEPVGAAPEPVGPSLSVPEANSQPVGGAEPVVQFSHRRTGHRWRGECWIPGSPAARPWRHRRAGRGGEPRLPQKAHQRPLTGRHAGTGAGGLAGASVRRDRHNGVYGQR